MANAMTMPPGGYGTRHIAQWSISVASCEAPKHRHQVSSYLPQGQPLLTLPLYRGQAYLPRSTLKHNQGSLCCTILSILVSTINDSSGIVPLVLVSYSTTVQFLYVHSHLYWYSTALCQNRIATARIQPASQHKIGDKINPKKAITFHSADNRGTRNVPFKFSQRRSRQLTQRELLKKDLLNY